MYKKKKIKTGGKKVKELLARKRIPRQDLFRDFKFS